MDNNNKFTRAYKEDLPENTIEKIRHILGDIGIKDITEEWTNIIDGVFSLRVSSDTPNGIWGQNGKGRTKLYALASAYAEYIERLQNGVVSLSMPIWSFYLNEIYNETGYYYFPDENIMLIDELKKLPRDLLFDFFSTSENKCLDSKINEYFDGLKTNGFSGAFGVPFYDVNSRKSTYLPLRLIFNAAGSTGMAAGNSLEEAIYQGLCEILERYAASFIYFNRITPPTIHADYINQYNEEYKIIKKIEAKGYKVIVKDFSCNKNIPVIASIVINKSLNKYRLNVGADTSFQIALSRTLTEILQGFESFESWENYFLDIPLKEHTFLLKTDKQSIEKAHKEFDKFTIDGSGVFPYALFDKKDSYKFNAKTFSIKSNYNEEVNYLLALLKRMDSNVYVRDVSFLGFPSVYIYASNSISSSAKKIDKLDINEIDYLASKNTNYLETKLFPFKIKANKLELIEIFENGSPNIIRQSKVPMQQYLRINFPESHYWSILPIAYFLSLSHYKLNNYEKALLYWEEFMSIMQASENEYYIQIKELFYSLSHDLPIVISDNLKYDLLSENIFENIDLPNCPNCHDCDLINHCNTRKNINLSILLLKKMKEKMINQIELGHIIK